MHTKHFAVILLSVFLIYTTQCYASDTMTNTQKHNSLRGTWIIDQEATKEYLKNNPLPHTASKEHARWILGLTGFAFQSIYEFTDEGIKFSMYSSNGKEIFLERQNTNELKYINKDKPDEVWTVSIIGKKNIQITTEGPSGVSTNYVVWKRGPVPADLKTRAETAKRLIEEWKIWAEDAQQHIKIAEKPSPAALDAKKRAADQEANKMLSEDLQKKLFTELHSEAAGPKNEIQLGTIEEVRPGFSGSGSQDWSAPGELLVIKRFEDGVRFDLYKLAIAGPLSTALQNTKVTLIKLTKQQQNKVTKGEFAALNSVRSRQSSTGNPPSVEYACMPQIKRCSVILSASGFRGSTLPAYPLTDQ